MSRPKTTKSPGESPSTGKRCAMRGPRGGQDRQARLAADAALPGRKYMVAAFILRVPISIPMGSIGPAIRAARTSACRSDPSAVRHHRTLPEHARDQTHNESSPVNRRTASIPGVVSFDRDRQTCLEELHGLSAFLSRSAARCLVEVNSDDRISPASVWKRSVVRMSLVRGQNALPNKASTTWM